MPRLDYSVENLIEEVQAQTDEFNTDTVNVDRDILPSLNRGVDYAVDLYSRRYPDPWTTTLETFISTGEQEIVLPENCFEDRVIKVSLRTGGVKYPVKRVDYSSLEDHEREYNGVPLYYCVEGRTIRFSQPVLGGTLRIGYVRNPEKLVRPQGKIEQVSTVDNYIYVDEVGEDISTEANSSFVNVIDGQTGEVKQTLQVLSIEENKITFRSENLTRETIYGRTVSTQLADDVELDDYICSVTGSCVAYFGRPTGNFLIQFAVAEIRRKLGLDAMTEEEVLKKFERQVNNAGAGRENTRRVEKRSGAWSIPRSRWVR